MATAYSTGREFKGEDLVGRNFGRLRVLAFSHRVRMRVYWTCRCECGTERSFAADRIRVGKTVSCGCFARETARRILQVRRLKEAGRKPSYPRERRIRQGIIGRCHNPRSDHFPKYGGRGITVCDRWRQSFDNFLADLGPAPSPEHSLDRVDNDRGYEPGNCRWATRGEQARNKRNNRFFTHDGRTMCMEDWSKELGLSPGTLARRLKWGWSVERALTTPGRPGQKKGANRMGVRCKFRCESVEDNGSPDSKKVVMTTQYDTSIPEDRRFTKWTPTGRLEVVVDNPAAVAELKVGGNYYLDLSPAD